MGEQVGLIGFGIMGTAMAPRLTGAGYRLVVFDADAVARDRARDLGHDVAESPAAVGTAARVTLISLPRAEHVTGVVQDADGLLDTAAPGSLIVDTSTVDPATTRANAEAAAAGGVGYLDAPVLGRPSGVGKWTLPVGGEAADLSRAEPVLRTFAMRIIHVGPSGQGNTLKLLNNLMFGAINAATCEVFALASRLDLDPTLLYETIAESGAATVSNLFRELGPKIIEGDFSPNFSLDNLEKDIRMGLALAHSTGLTLEVGEAGQRLNHRAQAAHHGHEDTAAVFNVIDTAPDDGAAE
jgi:3-hydroxyisobutyrate dehydrogenase-like beta-hydroxyacid dehydrogenase